jgi:hypothetical protein
MNKTSFLLDLIPYSEMYNILHEKFYVTHQELRYWIKKSIEKIYSKEKMYNKDLSNANDFLVPFISDLPFLDNYEIPHNEFFYPEYYFYQKKSVLNFVPLHPLRFVYQKDLTGIRNWSDYRIGKKDSSRSKILLKANEGGILRFYNDSVDDFTLFANKSQIWFQTFEGESYVENPESFFLLYDILNVERIFLGKNKELCLNELGIKSADLPKNVINLKNKKGLK